MKFIFTAAFQAAVLFGYSAQLSEGTVASPHLFELTNDDGTTTGPVRLRGGPDEHYVETEAGWTICPVTIDERDSNNRESWYYCEETADGNLSPRLDLPVGTSDPEAAGLQKGLAKSPSQANQACGAFCSEFQTPSGVGIGNTDSPGPRRLGGPRETEPKRRLQSAGSLKNLVVIFKFSDHATRTVPSTADIDILMNSATAVSGITPTGSVKNVFLDNSGGALDLDSTVAAWVTLDSQYTEAYCANGQSGLVTHFHQCLKNALDKVDAFINFDDFDTDGNDWIDAITFLHSGYGAEWGKSDFFFLNTVDTKGIADMCCFVFLR